MAEVKKFKLLDSFVDTYADKLPPFGFNGLGLLTYMRTYSRLKEDNTNERWHETIRRVVEGTYNIQKRHITSNGTKWNHNKAQKSAQEMYDRMFNMKFLPPGRGLWMMGTSVVEDKGLAAALFNCAFCSTKNIDKDPTAPFLFLMDASMLGVGVGFDTKGAGKLTITSWTETQQYQIPDTREGWVDSLQLLLEAYFLGADLPVFDYSLIRGPGELIKGFGGVSSGPAPLIQLHIDIANVLNNRMGNKITVTDIVDIMNLIGKAVVAGNIRRTAEIAFGEPESEEYLDLKDYTKNPQREEYGWTSNNSVTATLGMDYGPICERIKKNGEPGIIWLDNIQDYSRMGSEPDYKDWRAEGSNPCVEQSLEDMECCCLVETFPANHTDLNDYRRTLKFAYLYGKTVTLSKTHWPETNAIMLRNRRIGTSMSGIAQFIHKFGINELKDWCEAGFDLIEQYDDTYSDWFAVPRSIKRTSIKPSGTVSLLAGATPGVHYPESRFYIRRMRISKQSNLLPALTKAGYKIEDAFGSERDTVVVEIPVDVGEGIRTLSEVSMHEQLALAAFMQKYWADNQVSVTVTFNPETEADQIKPALEYYQYQLKSVSFLPRLAKGAYRQMPYEAITEDEYNTISAGITQLTFDEVKGEEAVGEKYCGNDHCSL